MKKITIYHESVAGTSGIVMPHYWNGSEFTEGIKSSVKCGDISEEINKVMIYIEKNLCVLAARIQQNPSTIKIDIA